MGNLILLLIPCMHAFTTWISKQILSLEIEWMSFHQSVNNFVFHSVKHVGFYSKESVLAGILLHYFIQKKSEAEAHWIHVKIYGNHALSETGCRNWFRCLKINDFDVEDWCSEKVWRHYFMKTHVRH